MRCILGVHVPGLLLFIYLLPQTKTKPPKKPSAPPIHLLFSVLFCSVLHHQQHRDRDWEWALGEGLLFQTMAKPKGPTKPKGRKLLKVAATSSFHIRIRCTSRLGSRGSKRTWRECKSWAYWTSLSTSRKTTHTATPSPRRRQPFMTTRHHPNPKDVLPGYYYYYYSL